MEEWFNVGKEVLVAHDSQEAVELYRQLLDDSELRTKIAKKAYERLLKEHTIDRRAGEIVDFLQSLR
jgi:spore maturation protein CgeB